MHSMLPLTTFLITHPSMFPHSMNIFFLPVGESSAIKGELGTREHHHFIPHNHKKNSLSRM